MSILKRKTSYKKIIGKVFTRLLSRKRTIQEQKVEMVMAPPMTSSSFSSANSLTSTLFLPDEGDAWSNQDVYITFPDGRSWMDVRC
jgi:hypothetical protein